MNRKTRTVLIIISAIAGTFLLQFILNYVPKLFEADSGNKYTYGSIDWAIEQFDSIPETAKIQYAAIDDYYIGMIYNLEEKDSITWDGDKKYADIIAGVKKEDKYEGIRNWDDVYTNFGTDGRPPYLFYLYIYSNGNTILVAAETKAGSFMSTKYDDSFPDNIKIEDEQGNEYRVIENDETPYKVYYMVYDKNEFVSDNLKLYSIIEGKKRMDLSCSGCIKY